jgi:hypothetical protein
MRFVFSWFWFFLLFVFGYPALFALKVFFSAERPKLSDPAVLEFPLFWPGPSGHLADALKINPLLPDLRPMVKAVAFSCLVPRWID